LESLQRHLGQVQHDMEKLKFGTSAVCSKLSNSPFPLNDTDSHLALELNSPESYVISRDEYNKACQTYETAFVPCDSCDFVQKRMKKVAVVLIEICRMQGLPSCLQKQVALCENIEWMNGSDMCRWLEEESKDIARITKHFEGVDEKCKSMQVELEEEQTKNQDLGSKVKQLEKEVRQEKQTKFTQRKYQEGKMEQLQKEKEEMECRLLKEKENLVNEVAKLRQCIQELDDKVMEGKNHSQALSKWVLHTVVHDIA
jgi:Skp family chaperone for outer membrane proteins